MKNQLLTIAVFIITFSGVMAQKSVPSVDSKGHLRYDQKVIGTLTSTGGIDQTGHAMTTIDHSGNIVDANGSIVGKAPKNGTFEFYTNGNEEKFTIGEPTHTGMCTVKNSKGKTVLLLHQSYKSQAACAIHCLYANHCMPADMEHVH